MRNLALTLASGLAAAVLACPAQAQQAIPDTIVTGTRIPWLCYRILVQAC